MLIPGGATYFNQSNGYADAGQHIYELAMELNDAGDYFPIFGTCLGFELLIILASGRGEKENRITCYSFENIPLHFTSGEWINQRNYNIILRNSSRVGSASANVGKLSTAYPRMDSMDANVIVNPCGRKITSGFKRVK